MDPFNSLPVPPCAPSAPDPDRSDESRREEHRAERNADRAKAFRFAMDRTNPQGAPVTPAAFADGGPDAGTMFSQEPSCGEDGPAASTESQVIPIPRMP